MTSRGGAVWAAFAACDICDTRNICAACAAKAVTAAIFKGKAELAHKEIRIFIDAITAGALALVKDWANQIFSFLAAVGEALFLLTSRVVNARPTSITKIGECRQTIDEVVDLRLTLAETEKEVVVEGRVVSLGCKNQESKEEDMDGDLHGVLDCLS